MLGCGAGQGLSQTLCHLPVVALPWPGQDDILSPLCVPLALVMKLLLPLINVGALTARFGGCCEGPLGLAEEALSGDGQCRGLVRKLFIDGSSAQGSS